MTDYIIVDTESSGLFDFRKKATAKGQPRMASIGMILANENLESEVEHVFLIRPEGWTFNDASPAADINGLTHAKLMSQGGDVREALRIYGEAIDQRRIVVGFNVAHDLKMLRAEFRHVGYPDRFMQTRHLCVMQGCRRIVDARGATGNKKAPKLAEACAHFGINQYEGAHTEIGDARSTLEILRKLRELGAMPAYVDPYDKDRGELL